MTSTPDSSLVADKTIVRSATFAPLDAARGLAALAVVAFHLRYPSSVKQALPTVHAIAKNGHLGVQMFFVVSGFCLAASSASSRKREETTIGFVKRRLRRIYPPLWCSIVVVAALPYIKWITLRLLGLEVDWPTPLFRNFGAWDWFSTATLVQAFRFGDMPLNDKFDNINVVYWSLAIEVQFYLVMAFALAIKRFYYPTLIAVSILGGIAAWCPAANFLSHNTGLFLPYWPMFAWGILVYECRERNWTLSRGLPFTLSLCFSQILAIALPIVIVYWLRSGARISPDLFAFAVALEFWLLILWEVSFNSSKAKLTTIIATCSRPFAWLGMFSYSIYLIHFNLSKLPTMVLSRFVNPDSALIQMFITLIVCVMCYPFFMACERPFMVTKPSKAAATSLPNG